MFDAATATTNHIMGHQGEYTEPDILGSVIVALKVFIFIFLKLFNTNYFWVLLLQIYHQRIAKVLSLTAVLGLVQRWTHKRFIFSLVSTVTRLNLTPTKILNCSCDINVVAFVVF